jgi:S1-C subfamily serine protease
LITALNPTLSSGQSDVPSTPARSPFVSVSRQVSPSVVNIRTVRSITRGGVNINPLQEMFRRFFPGGERGEAERFEMPSTGSGFVISEVGHILTNHHVIAQADAIFVRFTGEQQEYPAELVGIDPNTDLALLRITAERPYAPLQFGDSDAIEVGDWAIAIGNPFGNLEGSLTVGVISAKGRSDLVIAGGAPRYQDFIQTDASINFGNSGGPLVDISGQVIGVNTAVNTGGQGISFAIPSKLAQRIYAELLAHGRVIRGYLGIRTVAVQTPDDEGETGEAARGARIVAVLPDSPAAEAGLEVDDVIVAFDDQPIESHHQLQFFIAEAEVGREVACIVERNGERQVKRVVPQEYPTDQTARLAEGREAWMGMTVGSLDGPDPRVARLKEALGVTGSTGVMVIAVESGEPAAEAGIRPGDVLVMIDGQEVLSLEIYRRIRSELAGRVEPIEFLVRTGNTESYVLLEPRAEGLQQ